MITDSARIWSFLAAPRTEPVIMDRVA